MTENDKAGWLIVAHLITVASTVGLTFCGFIWIATTFGEASIPAILVAMLIGSLVAARRLSR